MGRRSRDDRPPPAAWESERTLAAAEEEARAPETSDTTCLCGSVEFLLDAYLHVVRGRALPEPVEVDRLTCPQCNREFEAVATGDGGYLRGQLLGFADVDE